MLQGDGETTHGASVVVFAKTTCGFSHAAIDIFEDMDLDPDVVQLNTRPDGPALQNALHEMTGMRTVPSVWVGGKFIGGYSETSQLLRSGELVELLREAESGQ